MIMSNKTYYNMYLQMNTLTIKKINVIFNELE